MRRGIAGQCAAKLPFELIDGEGRYPKHPLSPSATMRGGSVLSCEVKGLTEHSTVKVSAMRESVDDSIRSVEGLREFIHRRLCEKENLLAEQFRMSEMQLMKRGRCCGLQFLLQGPRSVRLGAIWAADNNEVYLYDTQGVRYHKIRLKYCLRIEEIQGEDDVLERPAA